MRIHRRALPLGAILLSLGLAAPAAEGAKPILEKIAVDDEFVDEALSDHCGFEITGNAVGRVTARTFEGSDRIQSVNSVNVVVTLSANGNTFRVRDVGADVTKIHPDGTASVSIIGQLPFDFTGVLKIDLATDEAILEPHHSNADDLDAACEALAGD